MTVFITVYIYLYKGNQWVKDRRGIWYKVIKCTFTGDATSENDRMDFAGGVFENQFFLRNCGFFSDNINTNQDFTRKADTRCPPQFLPICK